MLRWAHPRPPPRVTLRGYGDRSLARPAASAALQGRALAADVALVKHDAAAQQPDREEPLVAGETSRATKDPAPGGAPRGP